MLSIQDLISLIPMLCGGLTLFLCIKKFVIGGKGTSRKQKALAEAKANGCVAQGHLIDQWIRPGDLDSKSVNAKCPSRHAIYEYYVDGQRYTVSFWVRITSSQECRFFPETREIYYKKGNPKKTISEGEASELNRMGHGCLISFLCTIFVIAIVTDLLMKLGLWE